MSKRSINAPDGIRWPSPIVAVSKEEQRPWTFGWYPYADRATDRSIVASDRADPASAIVKRYGAPFHLESHALHTGEYWLVGPKGPMDGFVCVERKERDFFSSLTAEHERFFAELERMRLFPDRMVVCSQTFEALIDAHMSREENVLCNLACIAAVHGIPVYPLANRERAERFAAWYLNERWQAWLEVNPDALTWAREEERQRGIVREHKRRQKRANEAAVPPRMMPIAEQYRAPDIGLRLTKGAARR